MSSAESNVETNPYASPKCQDKLPETVYPPQDLRIFGALNLVFGSILLATLGPVDWQYAAGASLLVVSGVGLLLRHRWGRVVAEAYAWYSIAIGGYVFSLGMSQALQSFSELIAEDGLGMFVASLVLNFVMAAVYATYPALFLFVIYRRLLVGSEARSAH